MGSEWEEDKEFTEEQARDMYPNNYNNILDSGRWSNKYPKDDHILGLGWVAKNISEE